ncbi:hypothetical protein L2E82_47255 [Cichorium intybus]|uniref:Uncharacterized protein n=1 Tax=Cichorium intybus TaxID=13427 RepID=A0ACB8YV24_CICIN|nr:hypothetical protein L2E82_47255 [Cichorium intybus]
MKASVNQEEADRRCFVAERERSRSAGLGCRKTMTDFRARFDTALMVVEDPVSCRRKLQTDEMKALSSRRKLQTEKASSNF